MLENKIEELIGALEANTEALLAGGDNQTDDNVKVLKDAIGKAEREMHEEEPATKPASKKKASKKKARNTKPKVTIEQVKEELSAIDRASARAVLKAFDVEKLSDLQPEDFEAAITEAKAYADDDDLLG